jgi:endonuclease G
MEMNMKSTIIALGLGLLTAVNLTSCDFINAVSATDNSKRDVATANHYPNLRMVRIDATIPSQYKEYSGFALSFNAKNHTPNWVAWELLGTETDGDVPRAKSFWQDNDIDGCPNTKDYTKSGYDRGHMMPAADNKISEERMSDCFVLANMCPQVHELNDGAWKTLEQKERIWAQRDSCLIIVSGPIYAKSDKEYIGNIGVRVPSSFFKVIIAPYLDKPRGIGFVYPNMRAPGNMQNYSMTIDEVEKITGYDFFYALPDELENEIESKTSFKEWNKQ